MRIVLRFIAIVVAASVAFAGLTIAAAPRARELVGANVGVAQDLQLDDLATRSYVYASDGAFLGEFHAEQNREPVTLDKVPKPVVDAIIAVEDESFYTHGGLNLRATMRALVANVEAGEVEQGGSTITQQLVKNALLTPAKDLDRKTKEAVLAVRIEREMEKDEILERYLNTVYFGGGAYGVQAAAEVYWNKDVSELGWPEAAMLAGLIANPTAYDPTLHPEAGADRREVVVERLREVELITAEQAAQISKAPLPQRRTANFLEAPPEDYFLEEVKQQLLDDERLGLSYQERYNQVFAGGLRIHTTIDPAAQAAALVTRAEVMPEDERPFTAVIVAVEPATGAVRAMVGGPGFETYKYNVATQSPGRQPGSSMKTFALITALEQGYVPSDSIGGGGVFPNPGGKPYKITGKGGTLTGITTASSNGAFVRLGTVVGQEEIIEQARKMGMTSPMEPVLSLPLGVYDVIPLEMASAYASIANGGIYQPPYVVERVEDRFGNLIFEGQHSGRRVMSRQTACLATTMLEANIRSGTGTRARVSGHRAAGKTGTTQEYADAWFVGFTPQLATAVWMGAPDERIRMTGVGRVGTVFGGTYPAMMFGKFMSTYHDGREAIDFPKCESTRRGRVIKAGGTVSAPTDEEDIEGNTGTTVDATATTGTPGTGTAPVTTGPGTTSAPTTSPPTTSPPTTSPPTTVGPPPPPPPPPPP